MSIYARFNPDDIVTANPTAITTGLWSGDAGSFTSASGEGAMWTLSSQAGGVSGYYYFDVYDVDPTPANDPEGLAEVQFAVTYGHIDGGGAPTLDDEDLATLPTKAIYSQYRNLLLDPADTKFTFNGVESDHIYVINLQRARIREQLDPGNWELPLSGAAGLKKFIDDSGQTLGALTANSKAGRVFNVVNGELTGVSGSTVYTSSIGDDNRGFGLVYPDLGIIVLNPNAITPFVGFQLTTATSPPVTASFATASVQASTTSPLYDSTTALNAFKAYAPVTHSLVSWPDVKPAYNHAGLYWSMRNAVYMTTDVEFRARSAETISSTHYFVRLRNKEFNYSNNPTFFNADTGVLVQSDFRNDPRVYITTVGLYNDQNELLAVAKLSKPVRKSFDEELLLRVRLDF
jgi:hypothetical protein